MATGLYALPPRGITVWALGAMALVRKLLRHRQFTLRPAPGLDGSSGHLSGQIASASPASLATHGVQGAKAQDPLVLSFRPA